MAKRILPSPDEVRALVSYDPETGKFQWKESDNIVPNWNSKYAGKTAIDTDSGNGYKIGMILRKKVYAHRLAWAVFYGEWPENEIDHINGNPLDNRIVNLRKATRQENGRNVRRHKDGASGYKGVSWSNQRGQWVAQILTDGKHSHLGFFDCPKQAHQAYRTAAVIKHGVFSRFE